ncbi:hypothetical protein NQ314_000424 [Rhamnusium bicolor]|uniref:Ketimine reductase mu-crystallin n=1 Tax=Rhamnusium bicolor TaxID=1586634 RepID=A0AAV8ZWV8_9CUCU|nr:hypothetical protein NQ314_000424 [Rhamnusium bicolor]
MIFINEEEVLNLLNWDETFQAIETAMLKVSKERVVQNARNFTQVLNTKNLLLTMPGYLEDESYGGLSCKLVTMCPNNINIEKPLPTINANIMLFDHETGILKAVSLFFENN